MGKGEFEEILEECLSALLEGRRNVEDNLSLYPAWRGRLEPLLRAAEDLAAAYQQDPSPYVKERGLQRFLESARVRRRLRQMLPRERERAPSWRWPAAAVTAAVAVGILALISLTLLSREGETLGRVAVSVSPYAPPLETRPTPQVEDSALERVQKKVAELETSVREEEPIDLALVEDIENASVELADEIDEGDLVERVAATSAAGRGYELLSELRERQPYGEGGRAAERGMAATADVLERLGAAIPMPTPTPSPTPTANPAPAGSPSPSPTAAP